MDRTTTHDQKDIYQVFNDIIPQTKYCYKTQGTPIIIIVKPEQNDLICDKKTE